MLNILTNFKELHLYPHHLSSVWLHFGSRGLFWLCCSDYSVEGSGSNLGTKIIHHQDTILRSRNAKIRNFKEFFFSWKPQKKAGKAPRWKVPSFGHESPINLATATAAAEILFLHSFNWFFFPAASRQFFHLLLSLHFPQLSLLRGSPLVSPERG